MKNKKIAMLLGVLLLPLSAGANAGQWDAGLSYAQDLEDEGRLYTLDLKTELGPGLYTESSVGKVEFQGNNWYLDAEDSEANSQDNVSAGIALQSAGIEGYFNRRVSYYVEGGFGTLFAISGNNDSDMESREIVQFETGLSYRLSPAFQVSGGLKHVSTFADFGNGIDAASVRASLTF